jgi:hypothetical protein
LSEALPSWNQEKAESLRKACQLLFSTVYVKKRHEKYRDSLKLCPDDLMDIWFETENRKYMPVVKYAPIMPKEAIENDITGYVILEYDISKKGKPKNIQVIETTNEIFNRPSVKSVKKYLYLPTLKDGKAVESEGVKSKLTFQIQG